ncbi:Abi-like protein [Corynebacterium cystitidis DSM 20524]|uniref:Abi-like protein n=2 Tax=Corynebacterium cystitidis TaxID=35757 RepID=A0A1H9RGW9_9CORY|nr:Abi-like protein [Corynebacterium cystitidis DSM 20524]SER71229.1 hypothetical protein SAMN05661109_00872 [Corynebacterium cystitidis DSM 20524]SNV87305.1 Abi-like protein [Corynebacterium cystitidis]
MDAAQGNTNVALELYSWNAQMAGAALEQLAHLEVLLRHAVDSQLSAYVDETAKGIPWFLLPPYYTAQAESIETVRARLRKLKRETRDQIVAGLSFGFWSGWFGSKYDELWRQTLHRAFPYGSGNRKEVSALVERIRKFRNRVAHHDSLLQVDIGFEMEAVFRLASFINKDAAGWMRRVDRTSDVVAERPASTITMDTVIVPANDAWPFYQQSHAFICQAGRFFQNVTHMAFYADREVKPDIPRIKKRYDNLLWNTTEATRLQSSNVREERQLGKVMQDGLTGGLWTEGRYQVFMLSANGPDHVSIKTPLLNTRKGKSSAFVRKQRYTSIQKIRYADDVWDLL